MKKWIIVVALSLITACGEQAPTLTKLPEDAVILAFGDSLTYGTGAANGHDYPSLLANAIGREVINAGIPGEISAAGLQRLPQLLDDYQPDLLILIHGGNDILHKIPADETRTNLQAMVNQAKQRNIAVVLMGVPELGLLFLHSAPLYQELAQAEQVPIDIETIPAILSNNALKSDTVHPNDAGYAKLADSIATLLQQQGAL